MYRTLLVDDQDVFVQELCRLDVWGEKTGFVCGGKAHDGKDALKMLREHSFDFIITDIQMPVLDGIELIRVARQDDLCPCAALMSEYSDFHYARQGMMLGTLDYLVKPVNRRAMAELLQRARRFLDARQSRARVPIGETLSLPYYPAEEERMVARLFIEKNEQAIAAFRKAVQNLGRLFEDDPANGRTLLSMFYQKITSAIMNAFSWMNQYVHPVLTPDEYLTGQDEKSFWDLADCYERSLQEVLLLVRKLEPTKKCGLLENICRYILQNPETDIRLKNIAPRFYVNYTYLSNAFRTMTGVGFNDYVTMVKMERARYLFQHSDRKIYEISNLLGFHDPEYFAKLFKQYCGVRPTDLKHRSMAQMEWSVIKNAHP